MHACFKGSLGENMQDFNNVLCVRFVFEYWWCAQMNNTKVLFPLLFMNKNNLSGIN